MTFAEWKEKNGKSYTDIQKDTGIGRATIAKLLVGDISMSNLQLSTMIRIHNYTGLTLDEIIKNKNQKYEKYNKTKNLKITQETSPEEEV